MVEFPVRNAQGILIPKEAMGHPKELRIGALKPGGGGRTEGKTGPKRVRDLANPLNASEPRRPNVIDRRKDTSDPSPEREQRARLRPEGHDDEERRADIAPAKRLVSTGALKVVGGRDRGEGKVAIAVAVVRQEVYRPVDRTIRSRHAERVGHSDVRGRT